MNAEFEAIKEAWNSETGEGRDEELVRDMSDTYVADHPDEFTSFDGLDAAQCVKALEVFRAAGLEEDEFRVQVWIWHHFEPQEIGGTYKAKVRVH